MVLGAKNWEVLVGGGQKIDIFSLWWHQMMRHSRYRAAAQPRVASAMNGPGASLLVA